MPGSAEEGGGRSAATSSGHGKRPLPCYAARSPGPGAASSDVALSGVALSGVALSGVALSGVALSGVAVSGAAPAGCAGGGRNRSR